MLIIFIIIMVILTIYFYGYYKSYKNPIEFYSKVKLLFKDNNFIGEMFNILGAVIIAFSAEPSSNLMVNGYNILYLNETKFIIGITFLIVGFIIKSLCIIQNQFD